MDLEKVKDLLVPALTTGAYSALAYFLANKDADVTAALYSAGLVFLSVAALELKKHFEPKSTAAKGKKKGRRLFLGYRK